MYTGVLHIRKVCLCVEVMSPDVTADANYNGNGTGQEVKLAT